MEIPVRNTVFLQGIFFSDIQTIEDNMIHGELFSEEKPESEIDMSIYNPIRATKYKNKKQWAEAYRDMTIKCWYCGLNFKGLPCFIPRQIRTTAYGKEYDAHGIFCGFACAFSFLNNSAEFIKDKSSTDKLSMLKMLFIQFYGKKPVELREAPCVYDLSIYGGHMDIMEYRNALKTINTSMISEARYIHN